VAPPFVPPSPIGNAQKSLSQERDRWFESGSLHRRVRSHQCRAAQPVQNPAPWRADCARRVAGRAISNRQLPPIAALEESTRDRVPLKWARTQWALGSALRVLGEREKGTTQLGEAVRAYDLALAVLSLPDLERYAEKWVVGSNLSRDRKFEFSFHRRRILSRR